MFNTRPVSAIDFYKADHRPQYPDDTSLVYSNFTPRSARLGKVLKQYYDNTVVVLGIRAVCKALLVDLWRDNFFSKPKNEVVGHYKRRLDNSLGKDAVSVKHIEALHDLGYLPVRVKGLKEGSFCGLNIPVLTIQNTKPEFFWLTNYLEPSLSSCLWKFMTSATIAMQYRRILERWCAHTGGTPGFVPFQAHDFSYRGLSGFDDAIMSGLGHLVFFTGSDNVLAIDAAEDYFRANSDKEYIAGSVPATEHSVMCLGTEDGELETYRRLLADVYPSGLVSIVSDTWDYWDVICNHIPSLKDLIMGRDGKFVVRPDSGDPVRIIAGYLPSELIRIGHKFYSPDGEKELMPCEIKGSIQCLWETFGGTETEKGFRTLDSHIGLIYGDSITLERADKILEILAAKGFSSDNVVFGVGSYTYEYVTRDTFGFAMKATFGVVNGVPRNIYKDPKTDGGVKKSAKGLLMITKDDKGNYVLHQEVTPEQEAQGELKIVFEDGVLYDTTTLTEIRETAISYLRK